MRRRARPPPPVAPAAASTKLGRKFMYARTGRLKVIVCAPRVIPIPGDTYPEIAGSRSPLSRPPNTSRRGVPYASTPKFADKPNADERKVLSPALASQVSGAAQCSVEPGALTTSVVSRGLNVELRQQ